MTDTEARLIRTAKSGNNRAFGQLVKKYQEQTLFLAYDLMGNYTDAKDLAQETFIRAFQKLSQYQERAKFSTWLYRITVNLAYDAYRVRRRDRIELIDPVNDKIFPWKTMSGDDLNPTYDIENREFRNRIQAELDRLTFNQRTVVVLKYFHEKNSFEIAKIMDCKPSTVRAHLLRALTHLRKALYLSEWDYKMIAKVPS